MSASAPAIWNAASEESTLCALPPTQGHPDVDHRVARRHPLGQLRAHALLDAGDELARHGAADDPVDELEPAALGQRLDLDVATAYWPCPPDCLTCRPWPAAGFCSVSRSATRTGPVVTSTPCRVRSRSSSTSRCASPIDHTTTWWVSRLTSVRSVGSSAAQPGERLGQLVLVRAGLAP